MTEPVFQDISQGVFLGIDIGTSGIRGCCIDMQGNEIAQAQLPLGRPCTTLRSRSVAAAAMRSYTARNG